MGKDEYITFLLLYSVVLGKRECFFCMFSLYSKIFNPIKPGRGDFAVCQKQPDSNTFDICVRNDSSTINLYNLFHGLMIQVKLSLRIVHFSLLRFQLSKKNHIFKVTGRKLKIRIIRGFVLRLDLCFPYVPLPLKLYTKKILYCQVLI